MRNLSLGCGTDLKEGFDGADMADFGQKYVFDARESWPIEDNSYDYILAENVFEHFQPGKEIITVMNECYRVLDEGGILEFVVPKWSHPNTVADPTHVSMWQVETIEGQVGIHVYKCNECNPKMFWDRRSLEYWAGKRPRLSSYEDKRGRKLLKWAIENDGHGNYTIKEDPTHYRVRLVKGKQK